jgi:Kinesin-associated protein (KAP)
MWHSLVWCNVVPLSPSHSPSHSLSLPISFSRSLSHAPSHTHANTLSHTLSHYLSLTDSLSHTHAFWLAHSLSFSLPPPFSQNKEALKSTDIINKLAHLIPCSSPDLVTASLRLLFNLSFDSVRHQFIWVNEWMDGWINQSIDQSIN